MILIGKIPKSHQEALAYFARYLLTPQLLRHIIIRVVYRRNISFLGCVEVLEYNSRNMPREFVVEIKHGQTEEEYLRTLAHEMIHVKQYALGELNEQMDLWLGEKYESDRIAYHKQPWEIEAHDLSEVLLYEYNRRSHV